MNWDRGHVHGSIAEATRCVLPADDQLPDMLIERAQALGIKPEDLHSWIYSELPSDQLRYSLLLDALSTWAQRTNRCVPAICAHCGGSLTAQDAQTHQCPPERTENADPA